MNTTIPAYALDVLISLESAGFEAYPVGGCVRDMLLGKAPHDFDVCTNASPEQTISVLSGFTTIPTGLKHGTVTVLSQGEPVEVTTFRTDGEYHDHRRPEQVRFVSSLKEDLSRRDFTVNALCLDKNGNVIDMFDGITDLDSGIIRCVGDPVLRFEEDALRVLRALRFSSVLGFDIEPATAEAVHKKAPLLSFVSAERVFSELKKLLTGKRAGDILLEYRDVFALFIPELSECFDVPQNNPHHMYDVYTHICKSVDNIKPDEILRIAMLFHDIGKPRCRTTDINGIDHFKTHPAVGAKMAGDILSRLRADNDTRELVCEYIAEHDNRLSESRRSVARFISKHSYDFFDNYLLIRRADTLAQSDYFRKEKLYDLEVLKSIRDDLLKQEACLKLSDLAADGNDMLALGLSGRQIGIALHSALLAVIDGTLLNTKEEIIDFAKQYLTQEK